MSSLQGYNPYTTTFNTGQYRHIALCISGNTQTLYLDGSAVVTVTNTDILTSAYSVINQLTVGCAGDKSAAFAGYMDDFRVYNYAMTPTQISNLYINKNMIAQYKFDICYNNLTGNYATLIYDLSFVGPNVTTTTDAVVGTNALLLTNDIVGTNNSYALSNTPIPSASTIGGLSVSFLFDTSGNTNRLMRIFDLGPTVNSKGLYIDISGTNQINSGFNMLPEVSSGLIAYFPITFATNGKILEYVNQSYDISLGNVSITNTTSRYVGGSSLLIDNSAPPTRPSFAYWLLNNSFTPSSTDGFTFSIWYNLVSLNTFNSIVSLNSGTFLNSGSGSSTNVDGLTLLNIKNNNTALIQWYNGTTQISASTVNIPTITYNTWNHYLVTVSGAAATVFTIYINGVSQGALTLGNLYGTYNATTPFTFATIGTQNNLPVGSALNKGYLNDMRLYNRVLTADEIASVASGTG